MQTPEIPSPGYLVFIHPKALMHILDRSEALYVRAAGKGRELEAVLMNSGKNKPENSVDMLQDGLQLFVDKEIDLKENEQIDIRLKKKWFKDSVAAEIVEKQQVPGFMGVRDC